MSNDALNEARPVPSNTLGKIVTDVRQSSREKPLGRAEEERGRMAKWHLQSQGDVSGSTEDRLDLVVLCLDLGRTEHTLKVQCQGARDASGKRVISRHPTQSRIVPSRPQLLAVIGKHFRDGRREDGGRWCSMSLDPLCQPTSFQLVWTQWQLRPGWAFVADSLRLSISDAVTCESNVRKR